MTINITAHPDTIAVTDGAPATFSVVATGADGFQWRRNGAAISGAVAASYTIPAATLADDGAWFDVLVNDASATVTSQRAVLHVPIMALDAVRRAARIDDDRFDADLPRWIATACSLAEQYCDRHFRPATRVFEFADWPAASDALPVCFATGAAITYFGANNTWAALAAEAYTVFAQPLGQGTGVAPVLGSQWPALGFVQGGPRVRVSLFAGLARAVDLPPEVAHFIAAHCALFADEPRAATAQDLKPAPWLFAGLDPLKVF